MTKYINQKPGNYFSTTFLQDIYFSTRHLYITRGEIQNLFLIYTNISYVLYILYAYIIDIYLIYIYILYLIFIYMYVYIYILYLIFIYMYVYVLSSMGLIFYPLSQCQINCLRFPLTDQSV